jgi:tagatose-1,6-bisphosphate aldolase non-catalytic subunit AgaZ/GatZ
VLKSRQVVEEQKEQPGAEMEQQQKFEVGEAQHAERAAEIRRAVQEADGVEEPMLKRVAAFVAKERGEKSI